MIESLVIDLLRRSVVPEARREGGTYHVEYGRPFKAVAVVAWLLAFGAVYLAFHPSVRIEPMASALLVGLFSLLAIYLHSEFFLVRITYGPPGVTVHTRWGGERRVGWQEITACAFSKMSQNYVVRLRSGKKFTFSYFMSGYQSLLIELQTRLTVGS